MRPDGNKLTTSGPGGEVNSERSRKAAFLFMSCTTVASQPPRLTFCFELFSNVLNETNRNSRLTLCFQKQESGAADKQIEAEEQEQDDKKYQK